VELEQSVAQHYTHGSLEQAIFGVLASAGKDLNGLTLADLAPVDEFHIGGRRAPVEFAAQLELRPRLHLLDVGCGIGGPSRYFAHEHGCLVTGIDLTEEYVRLAEVLGERVGLEKVVAYRHGSALDLPFAPGAFDGAYMLHVGMNIAEKARLFSGIRRVVKPGGFFGIYDVMRGDGEGALRFPVPWASGPDTSFVESPAVYRRLLEDAGFTVERERSRREFAIEFFREMRARAKQAGSPPLGLYTLMGSSAAEKITNTINNLERGLIAPTEIVSRAI